MEGDCNPLPRTQRSRPVCAKTLRRALGKPPRVHHRRSFALDSTLYRVFEHNGRQYVSVATLTPRKRCSLPLRGQGRVSGNIRVVLDPARGTASVHVPYDVRIPAQPAAGPEIGIDAGVSEVLATSTGEKMGQGDGTLLERLSPRRRAGPGTICSRSPRRQMRGGMPRRRPASGAITWAIKSCA